MRFSSLLFGFAALASAQNLPDVLKQGEQIFNKSCATGYCHGVKGAPAGAPRLAGRGFDQAFINTTTTRGVTGSAMPAFGTQLSRSELTAVVAYVASLNGITNPTLNMGGGGPGGAAMPAAPALSGAAAQGHDLFYDAIRGYGRCATCHEINGVGISVATPISKVPSSADALRFLATPNVSTATMGKDSMPALVASKGTRGVVFYDLTVPPPVLRTVDPAQVQLMNSPSWAHSSVIGAYNDSELESILAYLRAVVQ